MLDAYNKLLIEFEARNINYVLWKSLEFYKEQLSGEGDIDVLFAPEQQKISESIMRQSGYAEDYSSPDRIGNKIKVFRGFDSATLKHVTVHAHFGCWFGSKRYKEFCFPHNTEMFEKAVREQGALRLCSAHFIITRILIVALRKSYQDKYVCQMAQDFKELSDEQRQLVEEHLNYYFDTDIAKLMKELEKGEPRILEQVYDYAYNKMNSQSNIEEICSEVKRNNYPKTLRDYYFPRFVKGKRNKISRPMSIMLAGHDGTGKTTVTSLLRKNIAKIAMSKRIYLGRSTWVFPNSLINQLRQKRLFRILNIIWPYTSTLEILSRLLFGRFLVRAGFIIIYDRSLIDLFLKWDGSNKFSAWFPLLIARLLTQNQQADLCYLLHADPDVVISRKAVGEHSIDEIESLWGRYQKLANKQFKIVDTTHLSPEMLTGQIIGDVFKLAADSTG